LICYAYIRSDSLLYYNQKEIWAIKTPFDGMRKRAIPSWKRVPGAYHRYRNMIIQIGWCYNLARENITQIGTMMKNAILSPVIGTRAGYVIRFTCPKCF